MTDPRPGRVCTLAARRQWPMVFGMVGMLAMAVLEFLHMRMGERSCPGADALQNMEEGTVNPAANIGKDAAPEGTFNKKQRNAILVEATILVHSILIGFDLGLQTKSDWTPLICAVSFHQFFEGFALGQILQEAHFNRLKNILMVIFYR